MPVVLSIFLTIRSSIRSRADLQLELLALRHQLQVLERACPRRVRLTRSDRLLWVWLSRMWQGWRSAVVIVKPETVLTWHRRGFRLLWTWKSRHRPGRPAVPPDVRELIRSMSEANPLWGAPRIHGELAGSASTSAKRRSRNTCHAASVRRHKHGGPSSPIMSIRSWPRTSSSCPTRRIDSCSCS